VTTKFTPGPWTAAPFSSVVGCPITAQPDPKQNTIILAGVHGSFGDDYRAEVEANAHLIAAAPALYEALERLLEHAGIADAAPEDIDGEDHIAESAARKALRLARGETS
jgi:hypothetical protein